MEFRYDYKHSEKAFFPCSHDKFRYAPFDTIVFNFFESQVIQQVDYFFNLRHKGDGFFKPAALTPIDPILDSEGIKNDFRRK